MPGSRHAGPLKQPQPKRRWLGWTGASLVLLAAGAVVWWQFFSEPPQPWRVRSRIARYLKAQTGQKDFQTPFDFPSKAAKDLGSQTNTAIQTGRSPGKASML